MSELLFLGIEGGGTKTIALLATRELRVAARTEFGPGNFRLLDSGALQELFLQIAGLGQPRGIGIGLAGIRDETDQQQVRAIAQKIWVNVPIYVTHDLQIALAAAPANEKAQARVLVLSGTGSCCYGERQNAKTDKVGGWGHLLGDIGSGYDISLRALKSAIYEYDRNQAWGLLGRNLLQALVLNAPNDLIAWAQRSDKAGIARLAPVVFESASAGDPLARRILSAAAEDLASDAINCARRLARRNEPVDFVLAGSVLREQRAFAGKIGRLIRQSWPKAILQTSKFEGALGAVRLAIDHSEHEHRRNAARTFLSASPSKSGGHKYSPEFDPGQSPTEQRNPKSLNLHRLSVSAAVELMLEAEREVIPALRKAKTLIERAVQFAVRSLQSGGRIFYVGAGTSGRLGVLDATECPPTFRASPEMIQGIIAGGQSALWSAVEGAEDDWNGGAAALRFRNVSRDDTVIGIAASGRTPFVWGALSEARKAGSRTVLLSFNPRLKIDPAHRPDVVIAPNVGPEILTGSTRLKSGTATKLILNMISTISMVRLGKVESNLMIDLNPSNTKLRDRTIRIVRELTNSTPEEARDALEENGWIVKKAVETFRRR